MVVSGSGRRRQPHPDDLAGRFPVAGRPLRVAAVENHGTDLVVVRDAAAQETLSRWVVEVERRYRRFNHRSPRDLLPLGRDARVRFVWPSVAATAEGGAASSSVGPFARPKRYNTDGFGLSWLLSRAQPRQPTERVAAAGDRPRSVVLVTDAETADASRYSLAQVIAYLRRLRVPLFVWSLGGEPVPGWGDSVALAGWADLRAAVRALHDELEPQAIVWLEGCHLPQGVELVGDGSALRWP